MKVKHILTAIAATMFLQGVCASNGTNSLKDKFLYPSYDSKPWTFWYWMYGAVSKEGITADLEAMKQNGLGGAYLMPIRGVDEGKQYNGQAQQLTDGWWDAVNHSMREAARLDLKLGMHICDGFALAGGPWITPAESMQKIVWSDTIVSEKNSVNIVLPCPDAYNGYYEDIAAYAVPLSFVPEDSEMKPNISVTDLSGDNVSNPSKKVNIDEKGVIRSSYHCYINYEYPRPITCRNVEIFLTGNNYQAHRMKMWASIDGEKYTLVKQFVAARHGWQNTDFNSSHSIPEVKARYFRFEWTPEGSEPGSEDLDAAKWKPDLKIKSIALHSSAKLNEWEGKAGFVWRVAEETSEMEIPTSDCVQKSEIIRLNIQNGRILTPLPKGEWRVIRMGHTSTGHTNATAGGAKGLECNKFDKRIVKKQVENWFGEVFRKCNPEITNKVLKYLHVDSWECGSQNWSENFASEFKKRRGYDLMDILPVMTGMPIESVSYSEKVLRDVRTTISELVSDVFYEAVMDCARKYDCLLSAECVSPTMVSDGMAHYSKVDLPMGEFWLNSPTHDKPNDMLDAICGAHIYGKKIIQAEGFTEVRGVWNEDPAMLKPLLDRNFVLGINKLFYHVYTHNPWMNRKPGMTLEGIGLFFQRDQTWWNEGKAFTDYVTRCQSLLQYGNPVIDIAVFTGEEIPRRAILPDRLVPFLPGIFGEDRVKEEKLRLMNAGQPTRVKPVGVTHCANMADPEDWINPLRGYAYDSFNKDALIRLAYVENGKMKLPGGMEYSMLIMPGKHAMNPSNVTLSVETERKIEEFRKMGIIIPELPYNKNDFSSLGIEKDVDIPSNVGWTHRRGDEGDIYFLSNQSGKKMTFTASFRIDNVRAELWNAVNGEIVLPAQQKSVGRRMEVKITLDKDGSIFVVFPKVPTKKGIVNEFTTQKELPITIGNWKIEFPSIKRIMERKELFDWSKEEDDKVKYYSGTAVYTTCVKVNSKIKGRAFLKLDNLNNVATVKVNGVDCGIVWTWPYEAEITGALKKGNNHIEIKVTNTWANAFRGADNEKAPFEGIWANARYRLPGNDLLPAGLIGGIKCIERN